MCFALCLISNLSHINTASSDVSLFCWYPSNLSHSNAIVPYLCLWFNICEKGKRRTDPVVVVPYFEVWCDFRLKRRITIEKTDEDNDDEFAGNGSDVEHIGPGPGLEKTPSSVGTRVIPNGGVYVFSVVSGKWRLISPGKNEKKRETWGCGEEY